MSESSVDCELECVVSAEGVHIRLDQVRDREVHVWQVDLADASWDTFSDVLIVDEQEKAEGFRTLRLRQYYRRFRSALRVLLAQYSGRNAADLRFRYGEYGKPELEDQRWHFNASHSGDLGLIAISLQPVGIDLELATPLVVDTGLINVLCHPVEKASFECLTVDQRCQLFYKLFTKKEAYCKAIGIGLLRPPSSFRFADSPSSSGSQVYDERVDNISPFFVYDVCPMTGYAASVCLPSSEALISSFKLEPCKIIVSK